MPEKMRNARRERIKAFKKYSRQGWTEVPRMDELTDEQWALVQPYLPLENSHGRPEQDARKVLNGILFYIRNALTWANIPPDYPSYVTLFRRYHKWMECGVLEKVIYALTRHLSKTSGLDYEEALRSKQLSFHQQDGALTIYLPPEYGSYWMQPHRHPAADVVCDHHPEYLHRSLPPVVQRTARGSSTRSGGSAEGAPAFGGSGCRAKSCKRRSQPGKEEG